MTETPSAIEPTYSPPTATAPEAVGSYSTPTASAPGAVDSYSAPTATAPEAVDTYSAPSASAPGAVGSYSAPSATAPEPVDSYAAPTASAPGAVGSYSPPTASAPGTVGSYSPPTASAPGAVSVYSPPAVDIPAVPAAGMLQASIGFPPVMHDSISLEAVEPGESGNGISVNLYTATVAGPVVVSVDGDTIEYNTWKSGTEMESIVYYTPEEIASAINAHGAASLLVEATAVGIYTPSTDVTLSGGAEATTGIALPLPILT